MDLPTMRRPLQCYQITRPQRLLPQWSFYEVMDKVALSSFEMALSDLPHCLLARIRTGPLPKQNSFCHGEHNVSVRAKASGDDTLQPGHNNGGVKGVRVRKSAQRAPQI